MGRTACLVLFSLLSAFSVSAQPSTPPTMDIGDLPLRVIPPYFDSAFTASSGRGSRATRQVVSSNSTVSIEDLKVPAAAQKELARFQHRFQTGNLPEAVKHLEKAVTIYPQIASAHQNLGVCYLRWGEYEKAVREFERASQINPHLIQPPLALAEADLVLKRYADAERAARRALDVDPENAKGRYLLGKTLAMQDQDTPEMEQLLRESFEQYPGAHLALAHILLNRGSKDEAALQLRDYVRHAQISQEQSDALHCAIEKLAPRSTQSACVLNAASVLAEN